MGSPRRCVVALAFAGVMAGLVLGGCGAASDDAGHRSNHPPTLFLAGDGELWVVDGAAETSQHIRMPELNAGDPPHRIVARGDRLVLWGYDTYTLDPRHPEREPEVLAKDSWIFIPSDDPDQVWVGFLDPDHKPTTRPLSSIRELSADGTATGSDVPPPEGAWPDTAFEHGLLFPTQDDELVLWDPETESAVRTFEYRELQDLGPGHGDQMASCPDGCKELWVTNVLTGSRKTIPAPDERSFEIWNGAFSPDGETLAVPVVEQGEGSWDSPNQLALVTPEKGDVMVVPGSTVPGGYVKARWTTPGDDVFLVGGERREPRAVVLYHLGDERAHRLDVEVGDFYDAAAW
jgi:hypothetical protein